MRRILGGATAVLVAVALSGCATAEVPDAAAVQEWMSQQQKADAGIGQMSALASAAADVAADESADSEDVRIDLAEPARVSSIEFSCFGAETMDAAVHLVTGSSTIGTGAQQVRCADGPVSIDVAGIGELPVSAVGANGINADGLGAWAVVVR